MYKWLISKENPFSCAEVLLNSVHDVLIILDEDLKIVSVNDAFCSFFNTTKPDVESESIFALKNIDWKTSTLRDLLQNLITKKIFFKDQRITAFTHNGEKELLISSMHINKNEILLVIRKEFEDLTPEQVLFQFKKNAVSCRSIIIGFDHEGKITFFNKHAMSIFGYHQNEVIGRSLSELLTVADKELCGILEQSEQLYSGINEGIRKDGARIWISWNIKTFYNSDGLISELMIDGNDITEHEQKRFQLEQRNTYLDALLDFIPEGIIITDQNKVIQAASKHTEEILGLTLNKIINKNEERVLNQLPLYWGSEESKVTPDAFPLSEESLERGVTTDYQLFFKKNGLSKMLSYSAIPVCDNKGMIIGAIGDLHDTTEQGQLLYENISQEFFYEDILNNIPDAIVLVKAPDNRIVLANEEFRRIIETKHDITGSMLGEVWSEAAKIVEKPIRNIVNKAETICLENISLIKKNNEQIYCNTTLVPISSNRKDVVYILIIFQNTTDFFLKNKETSDLLFQDEALLSSMVDGVMIHAVDGRITYMNPVAKVLHDIPEVINNNISFELFDENNKQIPLQMWPYSRALRGERFTAYEVTVLNKHAGRKWYASYNGSPVYDNDGKLLFAVISVLDITDRKKAQLQLQYANLKLQKLTESNIVGIVISNRYGDLIEVNDYYLNLIGYTREEVEKKKLKWNEITPPESLQKDYDALQQLRTDGEVIPYEKQYIRKDGSLVWVLIGIVNFTEDLVVAYVIDISTQKKSEEALRKNELQLRTVFNSVSEGIMIFDSSGKATLINNALAQITGYESPQSFEQDLNHYLKKHSLCYLDNAEVPIDQWPYRKVLRGESFKDVELRECQKGTGRERYFEFSGESIFDQNGKQYLSVLIIRNITSRKIAEDALRKNEAQLRAVFDNVAEGIMISDSSGKVMLVNKYEAQLAGFSSPEEMNKNLNELINDIEIMDLEENILPIDQWPLSKVLRGESIRDWDVIVKRKTTGKKGYYNVSGEPISGKDGNLILAVTITRDITERKEAENKLKASEARFRTFFQLSPIGVSSVDPETGKYLVVNDRLVSITGYSREELLVKTFSDITHPEDRDSDLQKFQKLYKGEIAEYNNEKRYIRKNGEVIWVRVTARKLYENKHRVGNTIGVIQDITAQKNAELQIQEKKRTLEAILEFVPQGLVVVTPPDGKILYASRVDRVFTRTPEDNYGYDYDRIKRIKARKPGASFTPYEKTPLPRALNGEHISDELWEVESVQGEIFQVLVSADPIKDNDKRIVGAVLLWTDITEQVKQRKILENQKEELQEAKNEAEQRSQIIEQEKRILDTLIENIPSGVIIIDEEEVIRNVSTYLSRLIGISKEKLIGKCEHPVLWGLIEMNTFEPPDYRSIPIIRAMREKRGINNVEYYLRKDDSIRTIAISAAPIIDTNDQVTGAVAAWTDITERKHIEQEHAFQAARYQAVFNSISEGLLVVDKNGNVLEINPALKEIHGIVSGLEKENIQNLQSKWTIYDHNGNVLPFEKWPIYKVVNGEKLINYPVSIKMKDGSFRYILVSGSPVSADHETLFSVLTYRDITKKVMIEKKLRSALDQLQKFVNANIIGIVFATLDGTVKKSNDYFLNLIGFSRDELNQNRINWKSLSPSDFVDRDNAALKQIADKGACIPYEKQLFRKDGSRVWISIALASISINDVVAFILDISDLKRVEQQLSNERNFISAILSTQGALVLVIDDTDKIIDFNSTFHDITLYTPEEVKGKPFWTIFPKEDYQAIIQQFESVKQSYKPVVLENWIESKEKRKHFIRWRNSVLKDSNGKLTHIIATGIDITDRIEAERRIKNLNRDLKRHTLELEIINNELEAFSYSVSHDLKAPLNVIDGFSQLLLEDYKAKLDPEIINYLSKIRSSTNKMRTLIDDMLTLSRISRAELQIENINLSDMVESIFRYLQESQPERKAKLIHRKGVVVQADRRLLHLAIENIIGNSWKYCSKKETTEIEFGSFVKDSETVYFIRDNGVGFDIKYAEKIFQPFQRLHSEREFKGTGIGLATVVRVLRRHNGHIWAESEIGKGAAFYFTLE